MRSRASAPARGLPGLFRAGRGREIAVFVYDGEASHHLAFGPALQDGHAWGVALAARFPRGEDPALVAVATDVPEYGDEAILCLPDRPEAHRYPLLTSDDLCWFLGLFLGDGYEQLAKK